MCKQCKYINLSFLSLPLPRDNKPKALNISSYSSPLIHAYLRGGSYMRKINLEKILALTIAAGGVAAGCGDDVSSDDGDAQTDADADTSDDAYTNHAPDPIDVSSVTPADGTAYRVGDRIPFGFDVPNDEDGDELTGVIHVTGDSDTTPGPSAGDYSKDIPISGPLTSGAHVSQDIDTSTVGPGGAALPTRADGSATPYTLEIILEDGRGGEARAERNVTIQGNQPPVVDRCNVTHSNLGGAVQISCMAHDPEGADLYGRWNLTTDFPGATIAEEGGIWSSTGGPGDVGLHDFSVTVSDGELTSAPYNFRIPYDEHRSELVLHCSTGSNNRLLLPETSVDAVATSCGAGFNPTLKPRPSSADPDYTLDVDTSCVQGAITSLPAEERAAHELYNNATTVSDVYSSCTVDVAQVIYSN
jgi:hypothetical protein